VLFGAYAKTPANNLKLRDYLDLDLKKNLIFWKSKGKTVYVPALKVHVGDKETLHSFLT